jgi:hypothetical protein
MKVSFHNEGVLKAYRRPLYLWGSGAKEPSLEQTQHILRTLS